MSLKKGDVVGRISYEKDVYFTIDRILTSSINKQIAILKGINVRVVADSDVKDLELINKKELVNSIKKYDLDFENRVSKYTKYLTRQKIYTGKILHLDGDRKYSEKSLRYYNKMGLNAIVHPVR